jgi:signal transduction histidine kinase
MESLASGSGPIPADGGRPWDALQIDLVAFGLIALGQLALIVWLLRQREDGRRAHETIKTREAALRSSYERIRQLAGRLIHAQEAARAGLARDLHDDICQQLAAVSLGIVALKQSSGTIQDPAVQQEFADLEYQSQVTFDRIRRVSHDLHPTSLRLLGLAPALKTHCLDVGERHHVRVSFAADGDLRTLSTDTAICLYRIAQEALRNAVIHGHATKLSVRINRLDMTVELVVTDEGDGFDAETIRGDAAGLGLVSMDERARSVGGRVTIASMRGRGTTVRACCPCEPVENTVASVS